MTFFYDLNKRLADLATKQDLNESKVAESEKWIQKAVNPAHKGGLHKALHVAQGEKIPKAKIEKATHSKNPKLRHMAQFAKNVANEGDMDEGNEFSGERVKAIKAGKKEFKVDGKTYQVTGDTADEKMMEKKEPRSKGTAFDKEHMDKLRKEKEAETHSRYDVQDTGYSKRYTRKHEDDVEKDDEVTSDEPKKKGRPKSTKPKGDERVTKGSHKYKMIGGKRVKKTEEALDTDGVMMTRPSNMSSESIEHGEEAEYNDEAGMTKDSLHTIVRHAKELEKALRGNENMPEWVQEKIGQIKGMMTSVTDYILSTHERDLEQATGREGITIEPVAEKAVSQAQQKFMGMAHAMQKGKKIPGASPELKKVAKSMKPKDTRDFAATKLKGLPKHVDEAGKPDFLDLDKDGNKTEPMKQAAKQAKSKKKEEVEETTVAGSVAPVQNAAPKAGKGGMQFGKGVYESIDREVESLMESMNVSVNMTQDEHGEPHKSITVTADGEQADALAQLLKAAGIEHQAHGCGEELEENEMDWPTDEQTLKADPELNTYAGGLNGPKSTGQSTTVGGGLPNMQLRRQHSMEESVELERSLFKNWQQYKG